MFMSDKPKIILPFIIFEFLNILLWISLVVLTVLVLGVYLTTSVDITTTVSVGVIAAIWTVMMFYLWLCVVSHYQILGEVQSMGSDQVKVLQEVRLSPCCYMACPVVCSTTSTSNPFLCAVDT